MGDKSAIEWTDATWNPATGCTKVSAGCKNCYMFREYARLAGMGVRGYAGGQPDQVRTWPDRLDAPLKWKRPRLVFVNSMSDLFHDQIPDEFIDKVFAIMSLCPQHIFQILTKRADRMRSYLSTIGADPMKRLGEDVAGHAGYMAGKSNTLPRDWAEKHRTWLDPDEGGWPLPNVWLGVSIENQQTADERLTHLVKTPAAVRFISYEPALGPVELRSWFNDTPNIRATSINWLICGGESGDDARPMLREWARSVRDQCVDAGVPFFFKQWGAYAPDAEGDPVWVGKRRVGRYLDGKEWNEMPARPGLLAPL